MALVLLFAGQLATIAHELAVEHVRCAEHGEVVDVSADATPVRTPAEDRNRPLGDTPGLSASGDVPAALHDDHGHCAFHATQHATAPLVTPAAALTARSNLLALPLASDAAGGIELAHLAPKTSPPVGGAVVFA